MNDVLLAVGTRKGLFLGRRGGRGGWDFTGPHFPMQAVYSVGIDTRGDRPRLLAGADSSHWGPSVFRSDDLGGSWHEPAKPAVKFPEGTGTSLERVWQLQPAGPDEPEVVYAGTQPGALFRSEDGGETFAFVRGLWDHPQRPEWGEGFGGQAVHTVVPDPRDPRALMVAVSSGGVYRSADGGESWAPSNSGLKADFLPDQYPEFGQCVHKVARDPVDLDRLYLQNHGGVYRSDDGGAHWAEIGKDLPADFGFAVAVHPRRSGVAYVFPVNDGSDRYPRASAAGCSAPRTRAPPGRSAPPGCRTSSTTAWCCGTRCAPMTPTRSGSTSAIATARCTRAPTRARAGGRSPAIFPMCCVSGPP